MQASHASGPRRGAAVPALSFGLAGGLAGVALAVHLLTAGSYGYFRDEFYYIACSNHLDWGYVDHPPLSIALLALARSLMGDSLHAIRLLPALAMALLVLLTALMTRALGGNRFAQGLAALVVMMAPQYLGVGNFYSMNAFEPLFWMAAAYLLIRIVDSGNTRLWLLFGIVAGLGLENKHSMLFVGFSAVVALLLTAQRKSLADKWFWLGGAVAGALFLPNLLWEARYGWPTIEFMRNAQAFKMAALSPGQFIGEQIVIMHPLAFPIWLVGLWFFFRADAARRYRFCGWMYVILFAVFVWQRAKPYYLTPIYPLLLAGGATAIADWTERRRRAWLRPLCASALVIGGLITAPLALPILPVERFSAYAHFLHVDEETKRATAERMQLAELPQYFADMFGWDEIVAAVGHAYESLSPEDRAKAAIYVSNYGEAGAISFLGRSRHLPEAISGHNNYWLWGPRDYSGEIVIVLGGSIDELKTMFASVEQVDTVECHYCMPFENHQPVYVCRGLKRSLRELWPQVKRFV